MSTTFANTIDSNPIYADRAENDKDGNRIDTTYAKLTDIPTVPVTDVTVNGSSVVSSGTAAVTVPTATSDLTNDSGFITLSDVPAQQQADWTESDSSDPSYIAHKPTLAAVATSGQYSDLSGTPAIPTVDSSYNASSYNAQSGVAVAQAIAAVPVSSYTAGDAIEIDDDEISVVYDSDTLEVQQQPPVTHTYNVDNYTTGDYYSTYGVTPPNVVNQLRTVSVTVHIPGNTFYSTAIYGQTPVIVFKANSNDSPINGGAYCDTPLSYTTPDVFGRAYLNEQDVVITTLVGDAIGNYFTFGFTSVGYLSNDVWKCDTTTLADPVVFSYTSASSTALAVKNPLPASTVSDANKVLKVNASGAPEWATGGGGSTYTAGTGIDITSDVISVDTSVVATQTDLSGKQDTLTAGTNVSITNNVISATDTTYSAGEGIDITNNEISVEAPVDIVAGTGITIDNPDGNTLRVSNVGFPISETDAVRCGTYRGDPMYEKLYTFTGTVNTSETTINMSITEKIGVGGINRIWINPANSFVKYGTSNNILLPSAWRLGSGREGSVSVINASTGSLTCRCVDTGATPLTFSIAIRYTVSEP